MLKRIIPNAERIRKNLAAIKRNNIFNQVSKTERIIYITANILLISYILVCQMPEIQEYIIDMQIANLPETCQNVRYATNIDGLTSVSCEAEAYKGVFSGIL